jgi:hypothetical protein
MLRRLAFLPLSLLLCLHPVLAGEPVVAPKPQSPAGFASIRPGRDLKDADLPAWAKLSFEEALKLALAQAPGKVLHGELELIDGGLVYSFGIVTKDKKLLEVEIDAGNGKVLATDLGSDE